MRSPRFHILLLAFLISITFIWLIAFLPVGNTALAQPALLSNNSIPTTAYTNGQEQVLAPDWSKITFSSLPAIEESGSIEFRPEFVKVLGYNPTRIWQAGTTVDQILMLGDTQDAFHLEAFNLKDISNLTGFAVQNLNLNDFGLVSWQTPNSLIKAIPQLKNLSIDRVAPIEDLWRLSGGWGSGSIAGIIQRNPAFGKLPLGNIDLRRYSLQSIPGLSQTTIGKFSGWQQSFITEVPGLSSVPFSQFPVPLVNGSISVAIADVVWSDAERGDPKVSPSLYISGTVNKKDRTVPVPCEVGKPCSYVELSDFGGANGSMHGMRWVSGKSQKVKGGFGPLKIINGGWEPTGVEVYPKAPFKVVLTNVDESKGIAKFALYFHACASVPAYGKSCTPRAFGPIPWTSTKENGFVIVAAAAKPDVKIPAKYQEQIAQIEGQNENHSSPSNTISYNLKLGEANAKIVDAINTSGSFSSSNISGTDGGKNACMWAVNHVLEQAGYAPLGNGTLAVRMGQADLENGRGQKINITDAQAGDIVLVDNGGSHQHIGFCVNSGCTQTISNSSSRASFTFRGNSNFSYPGSPYNGSTPQVYRVRK